jgi:hypothetical protein
MSDEPKRRPHYFRLAMFTALGALVTVILWKRFCPRVIQNEWVRTPPVAGAIAGAMAEIVLRLIRRD